MSSVLLAQFSLISKSLLQVNQPAIVDLYIYMPTNQNVLLFRKQGSPLLEKDLESVRQLKDGNLLVKKTDYESFMKAAQRAQLDQIAADPRSATAQGAAKSVLQGLNVGSPTGVTEAPAEVSQKNKEMFENAFVFVKDLLTKCNKAPSANSFMEVLKNVEKSEDPLKTHCRHVSALSTLCLVSLGGASIEDLSDIAFAGLIHDLGLSDLPNVLLTKHMAGVPVDNLNPSEKIALMRHVDLLFEQLKKTKTFVSDGARRIIEQHHETWAGTGFKGLKGSSVYRSARVLRIMDEFVTCVQNPDLPASIKQAFQVLRDMKDVETGLPLVDPEILANIEQTVLASA